MTSSFEAEGFDLTPEPRILPMLGEIIWHRGDASLSW